MSVMVGTSVRPSAGSAGVALRRVMGTGADCAARVGARVQALQRLGDDAVLTPLGCEVDVERRVIVELPQAAGVDVSLLETRRGPLTMGECVWLGTAVGRALLAMHRAGMAHGDVSPGNIVVTDDGVVVVDTVSGVLDDDHGTVGFRAPERGSGATIPGDVYSLASLLRWCAAPSAEPVIAAWAAPLLAAEPTQRPSLALALEALGAAAEPVPVRVPRVSPVDVMRSRAVARTTRIREGRAWRVRRRLLRAGVVAAALAIAGALITVVPNLIGVGLAAPVEQSSTTPSPPSIVHDSTPADEGATPPTPAEAAAALSLARIGALADGDGDALRATVRGDGALQDQIHALADQIDAGDVVYEELAASVSRVVVLSATQTRASVLVELELGAHVITTPTGSQAVDSYVERSVLELDWDQDSWAVQGVRPAP